MIYERLLLMRDLLHEFFAEDKNACASMARLPVQSELC